MTGGYGCIGSWVAKQLVEQGQEVWIFDLKEDTHRLDLLLDAEQRERVHFVAGDVSDAGRGARRRSSGSGRRTCSTSRACRRRPAGPTRSSGAKVNVIGTLAVFEAAVALKGQVERVVYASSAAVHGPADPDSVGPLGDEVRLAPLTHYGAYKVCNELNARVYWLDHGVSSVGLRPWTVYGVGRDFGMTSEPTKAIKAVAAGRPYRISYGGLQDLQYVGDVAAHVPPRPDRARSKGPTPSTSGARSCRSRRSWRILRAVAPEAARLVTHGDRQLPIAFDLDDSRLEARLGPIPRTSLRDGIAETYRRFVDASRRRDGSTCRDLG